MKKILFTSKNLCIGGMEKSLVNLLNNLAQNYEITLILEEKKGLLLKKLDKKIQVISYKNSSIKIVLLRKIINFFKRVLWGIKNKNKYDFSCNYATYSFLGSRLVQIASKNSALYVHSDYYNVFKKDINEVKEFFNKHRIDKFTKIIFVSHECLNPIAKIFPNLKNKMLVINNLVDYKNIRMLSKQNISFTKINHRKRNFIFLGRLENESKNLKLLLDSFLEIIKKDKNTNLFIVGDGNYKNYINNFIINNKLEKNIIFIGELENPYSLLRECDCLILTSNYEGFPVIFLEALALDKPIMTTVYPSDNNLQIKDYCIRLKKDKYDIVQKIYKFTKSKKCYNIDFENINLQIINEIKRVIEV